jgi:Kef-type K+ transport system membrane component KefB
VLGELVVGVAVGPFALGGLSFGGIGPFFPLHEGVIPVGSELYTLAQLGSVVLLFVAGLETDTQQFVRFGPVAGAVALGGVLVPFALGTGAAVWFGLATSPGDPAALFLGAILTACLATSGASTRRRGSRSWPPR